MIQLYVLSILCNALAGYVLFSFKEDDFENTPISLNNPTFHLALGILSLVTGVLKILSPIPSSIDAARGVLIIGDLIPAAAGIIAGLALIFGLYRQGSSFGTGKLDQLGMNLLAFRKPIALGLFIAALSHFILGELILL
ncbi:MAG: hypothetical protein FWC22_00125 [Treponema sp.]|nr:hypothetical protein [Treponema sp.]